MLFVIDLHHGVRRDRAKQHEHTKNAILSIDFACFDHRQCAKQEDEYGDGCHPLRPKGKSAACWHGGVTLANQDNVPCVEMGIAIQAVPAVGRIYLRPAGNTVWACGTNRSLSLRSPYPWQGPRLPWPISRFWARYRPRIHRRFPENVRRGCDVSRMRKRWQFFGVRINQAGRVWARLMASRGDESVLDCCTTRGLCNGILPE